MVWYDVKETTQKQVKSSCSLDLVVLLIYSINKTNLLCCVFVCGTHTWFPQYSCVRKWSVLER